VDYGLDHSYNALAFDANDTPHLRHHLGHYNQRLDSCAARYSDSLSQHVPRYPGTNTMHAGSAHRCPPRRISSPSTFTVYRRWFARSIRRCDAHGRSVAMPRLHSIPHYQPAAGHAFAATCASPPVFRLRTHTCGTGALHSGLNPPLHSFHHRHRLLFISVTLLQHFPVADRAPYHGWTDAAYFFAHYAWLDVRLRGHSLAFWFCLAITL